MKGNFLGIIFAAYAFRIASSELCAQKFPRNFVFGAATSAYQIEGAWNKSGKGVSVWDTLSHQTPSIILDGSTGDVASDSYHKYREDVKIAKKLGLDFYRFSLSWTRILPNGFENDINMDGINYYNNLINELLKHGIQPMVTIFHWDLPQKLSSLGGFTNPEMRNWFKSFARIAFDNFGDRVKYWITFNEPKQMCIKGADYGHETLVSDTMGIEAYLCAHNILLSHADVYHMYKNEYKATCHGTIGFTLDSEWFEPASKSSLDKEAASRRLQFTFGWFAQPIFSKSGNYPQVMIDRIANRSSLEGFSSSRLPKFSKREINYIKGTFDFLGLNNYATSMISHVDDPPIDKSPSWLKDVSVNRNQYLSFVLLDRDLKLNGPNGFRKLLNWIKDQYDNPQIIVTENGLSDLGGNLDVNRVLFYKEYLSALWSAIYKDGVHVTGYTAWSLIDNFEWFSGYTEKFGLYSVDFNDPNRTRTPKLSAAYYSSITKTRCVGL